MLDKSKVNSAVTNHSKLDVSSTHITTSSFMKYMPVYYRHMLPGEHLQGKGNSLARLAPVAVPTYGRCRVNQRAFFVPYRTVFPNWNDFITDSIGVNVDYATLVADSPKFKMTVIQTMMVNTYSGVRLLSLDSGANDPVDFTYGSNVSAYYTPKGRTFMNVLNSLGYKQVNAGKDEYYSALPLLCWLKVYLDWYSNSSYNNTQQYLDLCKLLKFNNPNSVLVLSAQNLYDILDFCCYVCYDNGNDVYTNAWDNPVTPNAGLVGSFVGANDITATTEVGKIQLTGTYNTPTMMQNANTDSSIGTLYLHQLLRSITDYVKRNQLAGSRAVDRYLARFGINLDSAKVDRSIYIASNSQDVEFGTVMQTVNTAGGNDPSNLGDYSGQGLSRGSFDFDFKSDEFGMFIIISSILPAASFYQGYDRNNRHLVKTDFYQPEFDNLGCSAIEKGEVYVSNDYSFATDSQYKGVFGFAPRLYEYKQGRDFIDGDFVYPSAMVGGDAWHLGRKFTDASFGTIGGLHHDLSFTRGDDASTYNRIFQYTGNDYDNFYMVYHFAVQALSPCKSLFDTYDFEDVGKKLTMDSNGSKVN